MRSVRPWRICRCVRVGFATAGRRRLRRHAVEPGPAVARLGDAAGWQEFFDTYWKLIYAVAVKAGLSDAEARDVVQETVVAVAKQMRDGGYDRARGSFKNWLCLITRRRIIDHFRRRTDPDLKHVPGEPLGARTDTLARAPDPNRLNLEGVWDEEWHKNLLDAAVERVKRQVAPKQFQVFDLSVLREMPVAEVARLLKVNAAQVYLARHRVGALIKREVKRLEAQAGARPGGT